MDIERGIIFSIPDLVWTRILHIMVTIGDLLSVPLQMGFYRGQLLISPRIALKLHTITHRETLICDVNMQKGSPLLRGEQLFWEFIIENSVI